MVQANVDEKPAEDEATSLVLSDGYLQQIMEEAKPAAEALLKTVQDTAAFTRPHAAGSGCGAQGSAGAAPLLRGK